MSFKYRVRRDITNYVWEVFSDDKLIATGSEADIAKARERALHVGEAMSVRLSGSEAAEDASPIAAE